MFNNYQRFTWIDIRLTDLSGNPYSKLLMEFRLFFMHNNFIREVQIPASDICEGLTYLSFCCRKLRKKKNGI